LVMLLQGIFVKIDIDTDTVENNQQD
jgi:hypothetical protein